MEDTIGGLCIYRATWPDFIILSLLILLLTKSMHAYYGYVLSLLRWHILLGSKRPDGLFHQTHGILSSCSFPSYTGYSIKLYYNFQIYCCKTTSLIMLIHDVSIHVFQPRVLQLPTNTIVNYQIANLNPQSPNTVITDYYQVSHYSCICANIVNHLFN